MSLRYPLPATTRVPDPAKELRIVPAIRPAHVVYFRRGADIRGVAEEVLERTNVMVDAAVGSGKSVVLPKTLALSGKALVFHVVPSPFLAADLYRYVNKLRNAKSADYPELVCRTLGDDSIPKIGVVYLSAAEMVGMLMENGASFEGFGRVVLYLDEAHESDAYTHVLRNLSLAMGVSHLVQASATFGGSEPQGRETPASCKTGVYAEESTPETWDLNDKSKPWSRLQANNVLVYTDSSGQAQKILAAYAAHGYLTYHLHARMEMDEFTRAMACMRNPKNGLVAVAADYSFRSGFTFDVGMIIDTGRVIFMDGTPGQIRKCSRGLYQFEAEQTAGRGGRMAGVPCKYFRPARECENYVTELEGVEAEAAALLYRILGFCPNGTLADRMMAGKELPENVTALHALNGVYPLTYYVVHSSRPSTPVTAKVVPRVEPVSKHVAPSSASSSSAKSGISSTQERTSGTSSAATSVAGGDSSHVSEGLQHPMPVKPNAGLTGTVEGAARKKGESRVEPLEPDAYDEVVDQQEWDKIMDALVHGGRQRVADGYYYYAPELDKHAAEVYCLFFPNGVRSVLEYARDGKAEAHMRGIPRDAREYALAVSLKRYNMLNVEVSALRTALTSAFRSLQDEMEDPSVHSAFSKEVSFVGRLEMERRALLDAAMTYAGKRYALKRFEGLLDAVSKREEHHAERLCTLREMVSRQTSSEYAGLLESSFDREPSFRRSRLVRTIQMPSWTGVETVRLTKREEENERLTVYPGGFLRSISGVRRQSWDSKGKRVEYTDGKVVKTRYGT